MTKKCSHKIMVISTTYNAYMVREASNYDGSDF